MIVRAAIVCAVVLGVGIAAAAPQPRAVPAGGAHAAAPIERLVAERAQAAIDLQRLEHRYLRWPDDRALFMDASRTAWAFVASHYEPGTGFVTALSNYPFATAWDIGSMLAAFYSARELGLLDDATYAARIRRILATLARVALYDERVLNMAYHTRTARPAGRRPGPSDEWGWSTTDLGRLLVWLKIVALDGRFTEQVDAVVRRNDFRAMVKDGYLWGENLDEQGRPRLYQEGRIGYEQYAARGFALWGHRAEKALSLRANALPVTVMEQPLAADYRRWDRLTSEPFVLWGLELGWDAPAAALARRLLLAQEARYRKTGFITLVSEDAIDEAPHFFYYYCAWANGKAFSIDVPNPRAVADSPRWTSAKAAFAFHALMPGRYTAEALQALRAARSGGGWASGVFEDTGRSTGLLNLNTAAVILTAALVYERGEPILRQAQTKAGE